MTVSAYFTPGSLVEALGVIDRFGDDLLVMAGGTVAMPLINDGLSLPERVMGLRLAILDQVTEDGGAIGLGATTTLTRLLELEALPILAEAARHTGSWSIRNMATIGGNLFTPPPGGDVAVALLAVDAQVRLVSSRGERVVPLADFYTGFMTTVLQPDELLAEIVVPRPSGTTAFLKFGRKSANTPAVVTVAVRVVREGSRVVDARIALGAVGPHPGRATRAEALIVGSELEPDALEAAAAAAAEDCDPFSDAVATDWYRRRMVSVFVRRALEQIERGRSTEDR